MSSRSKNLLYTGFNKYDAFEIQMFAYFKNF